MEDDHESIGDACPQLLNLIPNQKIRRKIIGGLDASEEKKLELTLGLPGGIGEEEEPSALSSCFFSKTSKTSSRRGVLGMFSAREGPFSLKFFTLFHVTLFSSKVLSSKKLDCSSCRSEVGTERNGRTRQLGTVKNLTSSKTLRRRKHMVALGMKLDQTPASRQGNHDWPMPSLMRAFNLINVSASLSKLINSALPTWSPMSYAQRLCIFCILNFPSITIIFSLHFFSSCEDY